MPAEALGTVAPNRGLDAPLDWAYDGADWPHRQHSHFVPAAGLRWHVQQFGSGPALLLVHGTGASTHSWHALASLLATRFTVTSFDLPGHGFTRGTPSHGMSLTAMSSAVGALMQALGLRPWLAIGHSAGAAIACRMSLEGSLAPRAIVSLNGALLAMPALQRLFFTPVARLLALSPLPARLFAWRAQDRGALERLLASTGSTLQRADVDLYRRLTRSPAHIDGALRMMAQWNVEVLERDLPRLTVPLRLIVGTSDSMVAPAQAARVQRLVPASEMIHLPGLGHLAHEERPDVVAAAVLAVARKLPIP
jgi:magnesium chelatase accessory protein